MFSTFNGWPEGAPANVFSQSAFDELVNVDDALMGAYMQNLLSDQGPQLGNGTFPQVAPGLAQALAATGPALLPQSTTPYALQRQPTSSSLLPNTTLPPLGPPFLPPVRRNSAAPPLDFALATPSLSVDSLPPPPATLAHFPAPAHPAPTPAPAHPINQPKPSRSQQNPSPTDDAVVPMDATHEGNGQGGSGDTNSGNSSDPSQPGGKRRRVRTAKQQVLNKLAQQRYRERRRQRYDDLQKTVDAMTEQLEGLQVLQRENRQLAAANEELRGQVAAQQQELQHIRLQLQASSAASGICSAANSAAAQWDYDAIHSQLVDKVAVLRGLLGGVGCLDGPVKRAAELPQDRVAELRAAVVSYAQTCMQLMCAKKPHMAGRMAAADWRALVKGPEDDIRSHWEACLGALNLSEDQKGQLLQLKKDHMQRLRVLYDERQRLNLTAMGLMLPHPHQGACADTTPDGKLKCVAVKGQLFCIGHDLDLHKVLDEIKGSLRDEQKGLVELNYLLVHRILDPVQSARLLVQAFPCSIDCLAISLVLEATMDPADVARLTAPPCAKDPPAVSPPSGASPASDSDPNACSGTSTSHPPAKPGPAAPSPNAPTSPHLPTAGRPCCSSSLPPAATACCS